MRYALNRKLKPQKSYYLMPLTFESLSHGTIAFGFFNIDSDMLLLEQHFLFGSEFCHHISEMAENVDD